jgi:hypothetical protein
MGQAASISRLAKWAVANGKARLIKPNQTNQGGLPCMGIWKAMWRWASLKENTKIAYEIFRDYVKVHGWTMDSDFPWHEGTEISWTDWTRFIQKKIRTAWQYAPARHSRFLRENGWV